MSTSDPGSGPTEPTDGPYGQSPYAGQASQGDPYGQGSYDQPPAPAPATPRNGLGLAALIVGIVSLLVSLVPLVGVIGGLGGVVAIVLGVVAVVRVRRRVATNRGVSITGIVLGALAVVVTIVWVVLLFVLGSSDTVQNALDCANLPQAQQQQCLDDALTQP